MEKQPKDNIEIIEDAILDKLRSSKRLEGFLIESFPKDIESFEFTSPKGCILVRYEASNFTTPQAMGLVSQDETFEFSVFIGLRYLQRYRDSYESLRLIKELLTGLLIKGKRLYPKKREFVDLIKGDLMWGYSFNITLPTQEDTTSDNIIPFWQNSPV